MKTLLLLLLLATPSWGQVLGYNQAWIEGKYGHDMTRDFSEADWRRVLRRTRLGGGRVLRVWLFEGQAKEGIRWSGKAPAGLAPGFLANLRRLIALARAERVRIYWTAHSGNWPAHWDRGGVDAQRHYNLLNDRFRSGVAFRRHVLGPVLDELKRHPQVNYGLDLMNEIQGSVSTWFWSDGWKGARRWMRGTTAFVRRRCPGLKVTVSSGHHSAARDILRGRFDGVGLDFLDVHVYSDRERIPWGWALAEHSRRRGVPLVVGEFGQKNEADDPRKQERLLRAVLRHAKALGIAGLFPWRLEDGQAKGSRFTFWSANGTSRPALRVFQEEERRRRHSRGISGRL
jgi:hypothetical protein